jgi:hypothetical protein
VRRAYVTGLLGAGGWPEIAAPVFTGAPLATIRATVRAPLSALKVPTRWLAIEQATVVPMLASGKVDKRALQHLLFDPGLPGAPPD